mgnify:FL=1
MFLNNHKNKELVGIRIVLISSFCFAFVPTSAKIALDSGASLSTLLITRCLIGLLILAPLTYSLKRPILISGDRIPEVIFVSLVSVSLIATTYHAIEYLSIALVLMIIYLFPIGVALITQIRGEESLGFFQWVCICGVLFGLSFLIFDGTLESNIYGIIISILGLLLFVIFIYFTGKLANDLGSETINLHISFWSVLSLCLFIMFFQSPVIMPEDTKGWVGILGNGVFYVLSYVLFFIGSKLVGITTASIIALTEPLFAAIIALVVLNQYLSLQEISGFIITISSLFFFIRFGSKQRA